MYASSYSQNTYFNENCMIRGSSAVLIWPKILLFSAVIGLPLRKLFVTLKASARTSTFCVSFTWKVLDKAASNFQVIGPATDALPTLPNVPGVGVLKAAGFKYFRLPLSR